MKIKLSDYILEQSISDASVNDIEYERIKAELEVATAIAESYVKAYNMGLFQELGDADIPRDYSDYINNQPQSGYQDTFKPSEEALALAQKYGIELEAEGESLDTGREILYKFYDAYITNIGDDELCIYSYYGVENSNKLAIVVLKRDTDIKHDAGDEVYTQTLNYSNKGIDKTLKDNMELIRARAENNVYRSDNKTYRANEFGLREENDKLSNANMALKRRFSNQETRVRDLESQNSSLDRKNNDLTAQNNELNDKNERYANRAEAMKDRPTNSDPNGTAVLNGFVKGLKSATTTVFSLTALMSEIIAIVIGFRRRRKYTKHIKGLRQCMQSVNIYLKDVLSTLANDSSNFNEAEFSKMVVQYNQTLNQAIQVLNQPKSSRYSQFDLLEFGDNSEELGQKALQKAIESDMLFENDTLIKTIKKNRGIIEKRLGQLDNKSIVTIIESTKRYQQVLIPSLDAIKAEIKRIESEEANTRKMDQMAQNQPTPTPASQTQPVQPPQQQKKPGELDAGNGMMMQQQG